MTLSYFVAFDSPFSIHSVCIVTNSWTISCVYECSSARADEQVAAQWYQDEQELLHHKPLRLLRLLSQCEPASTGRPFLQCLHATRLAHLGRTNAPISCTLAVCWPLRNSHCSVQSQKWICPQEARYQSRANRRKAMRRISRTRIPRSQKKAKSATHVP